MIVLDASVLIGYLDGQDANHAEAEMLLAGADDSLAVSPLTLAEALVAPTRQGQLAAAQSALHDLEIEQVFLRPDAAVRLADLRATTGLRMPDCCVLLAAEDRGAFIATFDNRLIRACGERRIPIVAN